MKHLLLNNKLQFILFAFYLAGLSLFFWAYATSPIVDPDFWWHLKTGELMSQRGWLLESDPFCYTGDGLVSVREQLILQGYWLWQIVVYGLYALFGLNGILLFNILTIWLMAGIVGYEMYRQKVELPVAIVMLTLGMTLFNSTYTLERPQIFSFVFATILLILLARVRDGGRLGWSLLLLMLVWANVHGGYVVGLLILACFAVGALFQYRHDRSQQRHILLWVALGLVTSLLNPNGANVFVELFTFYDGLMIATITEYRSTWVFFMSGNHSVVILWFLLILYGISCWIARRRYLPELLVVLFLAWFSLSHARNIGFVTPAMLPLIGKNVQCALNRLRWKSSTFSSIVILICLATVLWRGNEIKQKSQSQVGMVSMVFPRRAAEFVLSSGIEGRMLNYYNFGGYLLWKLYPDHKVFIDGRGLDPQVYSDYRAMLQASQKGINGRKEFEVLLERYDIDFLMQPLFQLKSGRLVPVLKYLLNKPDWIPVYVDNQGWILMRVLAKNYDFIKRYQMNKHDFMSRAIAKLKAAVQKTPTHSPLRVALAEMLIFVGRYDEAESQLDWLARAQPDNKALRDLRNQLASLRQG